MIPCFESVLERDSAGDLDLRIAAARITEARALLRENASVVAGYRALGSGL